MAVDLGGDTARFEALRSLVSAFERGASFLGEEEMREDGLILGFDLGLKGGGARLHRDGKISSTHFWDERKAKRGESESVRYTRIGAIFHQLVANPGHRLDALYHVDHVFYEDVKHHSGTYAAHSYGALRMKMLEVLDAHGVTYEPVAVGAVKKLATGKGNAGKPAMMEAAKERWGLSTVLEDEADALWIAETGRVGMLEGAR